MRLFKTDLIFRYFKIIPLIIFIFFNSIAFGAVSSFVDSFEVGVNDSGKSILLKLLSGYENPDYGQVFVHGLDIEKRRNETRKLIGYVPYENDLDPWLTLEENILFNAFRGIDL